MSSNILVIGASRGIGAELVKILAQVPENKIFAFSRNLTQMQTSFQNFKNVETFELDLADPEMGKDFASALAALPSIDCLIYNAGKLINKPFEQLDISDLTASFQVNLFGAFELIKLSLPKMNRQAHVVMISSMGGVQGSVKFPGLSAYSTAKAALCCLTEMLAEEYKDSGLAFNCLALGAAQTEMLSEAFPGYQAPLSAGEMATFIADFSQNAHKYIRGKIIPVSLSTP